MEETTPKDPGLSSRSVSEGGPVALGVKVREKLKAALLAVADEEERSPDYIVDELPGIGVLIWGRFSVWKSRAEPGR
jgi:hypothetical protein